MAAVAKPSALREASHFSDALLIVSRRQKLFDSFRILTVNPIDRWWCSLWRRNSSKSPDASLLATIHWAQEASTKAPAIPSLWAMSDAASWIIQNVEEIPGSSTSSNQRLESHSTCRSVWCCQWVLRTRSGSIEQGNRSTFTMFDSVDAENWRSFGRCLVFGWTIVLFLPSSRVSPEHDIHLTRHSDHCQLPNMSVYGHYT
jgi:hypothetical protein